MIALVPVALGAGLMYLILRPSAWVTWRSPTGCVASAGADCAGPGLSETERSLVSSTLAMSNADLVASAQPRGLDRAGVVADLYDAADLVASRGHDVAARLLRDKAMLLSRERDAGVLPALSVSSAAPPPPAPSSPGFAAPSPPGFAGFAGSGTAPVSPMMSPTVAMPEVPVGQPVIAVMFCGPAGCSVRPEPKPWNDAWGRFGFKVPRGFRVDVTSFGPPGWARVELDHPDHGRVPGFAELSSLTTETPPAPAMPAAQAQRAATGASARAARPALPGVLARPTAEQKKRMQMRQRARARAAQGG